MVNGMRKDFGDNPKKWHYSFMRMNVQRLPGPLSNRPPWARFKVTHFDMHPATEHGAPSVRLWMVDNPQLSSYNPDTDEWLKYKDREGQFLVETTCPLVEGIDLPLSNCFMSFMRHEIDEVEQISDWKGHFLEYVENECSKWSKRS